MTMKMSPELYATLKIAVGHIPANATMRQRWDAMWRAHDAGGLNVMAFYNAGLTDDHIDTALRSVARCK